MKILIVSARYRPETFSIGPIAEKLAEMGNEVTVLTGKPNYGANKIYDGYENVNEEVINGVKVFRVNEKPRTPGVKGLIKNYLSIYKQFPKKLKKLSGDFDIVISHCISPIFTMRGIKKFCKKRNIPHMHYGLDIWPESFAATGYLKKKSLLFKIIKSYSVKLYKTCDLITFASPCVEEYFKNELKVNVPFRHIYQPCLTKKPDFEVVDKFDFNHDGKKHILFCGTIARFSHLEFIINAFKNTQIKDNFIFDIVGSGSELENTQNLVKELGLEESVIFHGRVPSEETVKFYLNSDFLFVPLYQNSVTSKMIPQKVIEYFMYAKPIVGMLGGDGKALIEQASNGNIICDQTVESLETGLIKALSFNGSELKKYGIDNYRFFENNVRFSLDAVCKELLESAQNLLDSK